mmetsp:Transcript_10080/g.17729  ORF Transcript_10080/g.17729 Transcript_10080/m.17729 type:complete len:464 (+) Transcript_10080:82-1473(+)
MEVTRKDDGPRGALDRGLAFYAEGIALEESLGNLGDGKVPGNEAIDFVLTTVDDAIGAYFAASKELMGALATVSRGGRAHSLLVEQVGFLFGRVDVLQSLVETPLTAKQAAAQRARARLSQPTNKNEVKRTKVAHEVLATEKSYVKSLEALLRHYVVPLSSGENPVLTQEEKRKMFGNIEQILGLAQSFIKALEGALKNWGPWSEMGGVFKTFAMFFKMYIDYTGSFKTGSDQAGELLKNNPRAKQIGEAAMAAGTQPIGSLMIQPIQRLPRYVLLLKELRKRTPDDHADASKLEAALVDIRVVADQVNETLHQNEDTAKILAIQSSLWSTRPGGVPVTLFAPGRHFIREGKLNKVRSIGTLREVRFFLFTDIIMYCTASRLWPNRLHYHNHLEFYGASDGKQAAQALGCRSDTVDLAFKVTSAEKFRVFIAPSLEERNEWMQLINDCAEKKRDLDKRRSLRL